MKVSVLINCPEEFKLAAEVSAQQAGISLAELFRRSVANAIGFDLSKIKVEDKRRKYANEEERYKVYLERRKREREAVNKLLSALAHEQLSMDRSILIESLAKRGVSVEDVL